MSTTLCIKVCFCPRSALCVRALPPFMCVFWDVLVDSDWPLSLVFPVLQGCSMFTSVKAFEGQHYSTLKRQCLQSGLLFEDPRFPATDDSLFYQGNRIGRVVWKRPRVSQQHHLYVVARYLLLLCCLNGMCFTSMCSRWGRQVSSISFIFFIWSEWEHSGIRGDKREMMTYCPS